MARLIRLAQTTGIIGADGSVAFTANQSMGSNKLTSLADGTAASDAVNKGQLDAATLGLQWREPVDAKEYVGNLAETAIEALSPTAGDAYVVSAVDGDATIDGTAAAIGDIFEYNGSVFVKIVTNVGGFPPAGTRVIASTQTALVSPLTDATDDGKIVEFGGASLTPDLTLGESTDGSAVLVKADGSYFENNAYVFDGAVPTGSWIQFSSGVTVSFGTISADAGTNPVADSANDTLNLTGGDGITTTGDSGTDTVTFAVDLEAAGVGTGGLAFDVGEIRVFAGPGIELTASGVEVDLDGDSISKSASGIKAAVPTASDKELTPSASGAADGVTTGLTITSTPGGDGMVDVYVNGQLVELGQGVKTADCYFSADGGTTARAISAIASGDTLYWNGVSSTIGPLLATDVIDLVYNVA